MKRLVAFAVLLCAVLSAPRAARAEDAGAHGHFERTHIYRPKGAPLQFVLFISGRQGWDATAAKQAQQLASHGALVAGVDLTRLQGTFRPDQLSFGDFENLSHYLQGYARLDTYHTPLLATVPSSAAYVRAMAAKAPRDLFVSLIVAGDAPHLLADYDRLAAANIPALPPPPPSLADLPIVEEAPTGAATSRAAKDTFAIFLSGDGGWAGLDKQVAAALTERGVPVVGIDTLRYFWSRRTPESLANDLDRTERYYANRFKRRRVLLLGYSQGANVLPAAYNRLPGPTRRMVAQMVLIGLENHAAWQFHLSNWIASPADAKPIEPEADKLSAAITLCLYGEGDHDALCPKLPATAVTAEELPGGHHFNGAYGDLAARVLERLR